jgi:hypothetical protein
MPAVTVVMNTSPIKSNPSSDLLEKTAASFDLVPGLQQCPKLIICDGYRVAKKRKKYDITETEAAAYEQFKNSVREFSRDPSSVFFGAQILELEGRHGFGLALKEGMQHIKTEFMMVAQHDWAFSRKCLDLQAAVETMREMPRVKYLGMLSSPTLGYPHKIMASYSIDLKPHILKSAAMGPKYSLVPLIYWHDKTHLARTSHYREFVFKSKVVKQGGFIETTLGQQMLEEIKADGMGGHAKVRLVQCMGTVYRYMHGGAC